MIIDDELLVFITNVSAIVREKAEGVGDTNILKAPMLDFCEFAEKARVGDDMRHFTASLVSAVNLVGVITTEVAEEKLLWLRQHGVYGAWEKRGVLELMRGKSSMIDSWIISVMNKPGDLVVPVEILKEWGEVVELAKLEPVGGVQ